MRVLVTGATGNVGLALLSQLLEKSDVTLVAGGRGVEASLEQFNLLHRMECRHFDFEDASTFDGALEGIDLVFILRPPQISDIPRYFEPLVKKIKDKGITRVVLLSVQGAERSNIIPHRKIEKLILAHQLDYIFLRPSYFMENLITTLLPEIQAKRSITLPSRQAKFNWLSVKDIGCVGAHLIANFDQHKNQAYTLSGTENLSFGEVVQRVNHLTHANIEYRSVNPVRYYFLKRGEGLPKGKVIVMLVLHFLPVIQGPPEVSDSFQQLMQRSPISIDDFIQKHQATFRSTITSAIQQGS